MDIFNLITKIIFFSCLGWSACILVFFFIKRHLERKKAKKEVLEEVSKNETEQTSK